MPTSYPNPVPGRIQAYTEPWQGTPTFRVTNPSSNHNPPAVDFGNGRSGDPVTAIAAGNVIERRPTPDGVVTIEAGDGSRQVYAHMTGSFPALGSWVALGAVIGYVGAVGLASGPHLHLQISTRGTTWVDPWPLLAQNQGGDMRETTITLTPYPDGPRRWYAKGGHLTGYAPDGATKVVELAAGSNAQADASALIEQEPKIAPNGTFLHVLDGALGGWYIIPAQVDGPYPNDEPEEPPEEEVDVDLGVIGIAIGIGALLAGIGLLLAGLALAGLLPVGA